MRLVAAAAVFALSACGRWAGPLEEEVDQLSYWLVLEGSNARGAECSDSVQAEEVRLDTPAIGGAIAYYFIFRVNPGLKTAAAYDCTDRDAWNAASCTPVDGLEWTIDDHTLSMRVRALEFTKRGCDVVSTYTASLVDEGVDGTTHEEIRFELVGKADACADAEASLRAQSPNGKGITACVLTRDTRVAFARAVPKVH